MLRYALRRAVWLVPTLLIVTFLVYVALRLGTDPVASYRRTNIRVSKKKLDQYIATNGLYTGAFGYIRGYFAWLWGFITLDWPRSIKGSRDVWPHLKDALANSLRLGLIATVTGIIIGNLLGIAAALRPGRRGIHISIVIVKVEQRNGTSTTCQDFTRVIICEP